MQVIKTAIICFLLLTASGAHAIQLRQIARVSNPVGIVSDGSGRLFILQQTGEIRILDGNRLLKKTFLNLSKDVSCCGERGLLGLAFHPNFANNGRFFVDYTRGNGDIVIARFKVSSNPNIALHGSRRVLLNIPHHDYGNHNGGQLQFGRDGYLYISVGDGGSGGDPSNNAQNLGVLLGKILRIDVNSGSPYGIPSTNPFRSNPSARAEIWAYGLRNPWRFTFDRKTGDLFIADVGQGGREEIDFQKASSRGGKNFGWRRMEGTACYNPGTDCRTGGLRSPILEYSHDNGNCSVIGGYRYRGTQIPSLAGTYLYADLCSGTLWGGKKRTTGGWKTRVLLQTGIQISSFGEDPSGEIYFADYGNGAILKIVQ